MSIFNYLLESRRYKDSSLYTWEEERDLDPEENECGCGEGEGLDTKDNVHLLYK